MPSSEQNQVGLPAQTLEPPPSTKPPLDTGDLHARASYLGRQLLIGGGTSDNFPLSEPRQPSLTGDTDNPSRSEIYSRQSSQTIARAETLPDEVSMYLDAARAPNTRRAYDFDLEDFRAWGGHLPSSPDEVTRYLSNRAGCLRPSSLRRRLAALASLHHDRGYPDPTKATLVRRVMQGIERTHGIKTEQVAPLIIGELALTIASMGTSPRDLRDKAILLVGFFGALRRSEITALDVSSATDSGQGIDLMLERSKTDQAGHGRTVHLMQRHDALCPVHSLTDWLGRRGSAPGAIFGATSNSVPLERLSGRSIATIIKNRTAAAGLVGKRYSGHSLRAGYATSAALAGFDATVIARQTGHRTQNSLSAYVRLDQRSMPNLPTILPIQKAKEKNSCVRPESISTDRLASF